MPSLLSLALSHTLTRLKVLLFIPVCVVCQISLLARLLETNVLQHFRLCKLFFSLDSKLRITT